MLFHSLTFEHIFMSTDSSFSFIDMDSTMELMHHFDEIKDNVSDYSLPPVPFIDNLSVLFPTENEEDKKRKAEALPETFSGNSSAITDDKHKERNVCYVVVFIIFCILCYYFVINIEKTIVMIPYYLVLGEKKEKEKQFKG